MSTVLDILSWVLLVGGGLISIVSGIGLLRFPDLFTRMHAASSREAQRAEGIRIAAETLRHARGLDQVSGAYIFPPFGRYSAVLDVIELSQNIMEV